MLQFARNGGVGGATIRFLQNIYASYPTLPYLHRKITGVDRVVDISSLKKALCHLQSQVAPGLIPFYNIMCIRNHGVTCNDLLLTSPSTLLSLITSLYRGDEYTAIYAFKLIFLNPLEQILGAKNISNNLLELARIRKDNEFIQLINSVLKEKQEGDRNGDKRRG